MYSTLKYSETSFFLVVYRYLYTDGLPGCGERGAGSGGERGEGGSAGGGGGKGMGKGSKCKGGKGADAKGDEEEATRRQVLERETPAETAGDRSNRAHAAQRSASRIRLSTCLHDAYLPEFCLTAVIFLRPSFLSLSPHTGN